jgi:hypothetical protein
VIKRLLECGCLIDDQKGDIIRPCFLHDRWRLRMMDEFMNYAEDDCYQDIDGLDMEGAKTEW